MTDSQRLLLSYMQNPPGRHYNSASALQLPDPTCKLPDTYMLILPDSPGDSRNLVKSPDLPGGRNNLPDFHQIE